MLMNIRKLFANNRYDPEEAFALRWKKPDELSVLIKKSDLGYFAKVTSFDGNVVTQAKTGRELVEMVNDAIYEYLSIPEIYRQEWGYFLPPESVREELKIEIPKKYLDKELELVRS
jgi:predicted RNase H-like HicB family nuclease